MIYILIPATQRDTANQWVKDNADHEGGENTFTVNCKDSRGTDSCLISFPNDGDFADKMVSHFLCTFEKPIIQDTI